MGTGGQGAARATERPWSGAPSGAPASPSPPSASAAPRWGTCRRRSPTRWPRSTPWRPCATAFASPITFIDTAASYGDGESERRIGIVLRELGGLPPGHVLATKADRDLHSGDFSGDQMRALGRAQPAPAGARPPAGRATCTTRSTPPSRRPPPRGAPVETLLRLKDEGLIEHVGLAGGPIDMSIRYVETGAFEAVITHNRYTLLNRSAEPLLDVAQRAGPGRGQRRPVRQRHPGQGPGRLPPLRLPGRPPGDDRPRAPDGRRSAGATACPSPPPPCSSPCATRASSPPSWA